MPMKTKLSTILLGVAAFAVTGVGFALAQALDAETQARVARFEKGPATVNVSTYPPAIQQDYQVFTEKCSQCHKLSRPINSDYALPDEWSRYVHRMMSKPGSGIDSGSGAKIYEFLVYDSSVRKKAMVDAKLAKASPAEKAAEEAKIKAVHDKFAH
jgi:cytochrome c1